jgi:peptide chain release factor 3
MLIKYTQTTLRICDTLTEGKTLNFVGVPSFAPEIIRRERLTAR